MTQNITFLKSTIATEFQGIIGGIAVNPTVLTDSQLSFSQPTINSGLSVIARQSQPLSLFLNSFTWDALGAVVITFLIIGILFHMLEKKNMYINDYFFHTINSFFNIKDQRFKTLSARYVQLAFWTFGFVIVSYFLSSLVLQIAQQKIMPLQKRNQLQGKNVSSTLGYSERVINENSFNVTTDWPTRTSDFNQFMTMKKINYGFLETFKAEAIDYQNCDIKNQIKSIIPQDFGILFLNLDDTIAREINKGILKQQLVKNSEQFLSDFIKSNIQQCVTNIQYFRSDVISISDVWQVYLLLAGAIILGLVWKFVKKRLRPLFSRYFYFFETNWIRRKRDQYVTKRIRKYWSQGTAQIIAELRKERNFRKKGVGMLNDHIHYEKKYAEDHIKGIFDQIVQEDPYAQITEEQIQNAMNSLPFHVIPVEMYTPHTSLSGHTKNPDDEIIPLEDLGRITPLVEYFTSINAPRPRPHLPQGKNSGSASVESDQYFKYQKKLNQRIINPMAQSKLFKDILENNSSVPGGQEIEMMGFSQVRQQDANNKMPGEAMTENMIKNRFNLNIKKLRNQYGKILPKVDNDYNPNNISKNDSKLHLREDEQQEDLYTQNQLLPDSSDRKLIGTKKSAKSRNISKQESSEKDNSRKNQKTAAWDLQNDKDNTNQKSKRKDSGDILMSENSEMVIDKDESIDAFTSKKPMFGGGSTQKKQVPKSIESFDIIGRSESPKFLDEPQKEDQDGKQIGGFFGKGSSNRNKPGTFGNNNKNNNNNRNSDEEDYKNDNFEENSGQTNFKQHDEEQIDLKKNVGKFLLGLKGTKLAGLNRFNQNKLKSTLNKNLLSDEEDSKSKDREQYQPPKKKLQSDDEELEDSILKDDKPVQKKKSSQKEKNPSDHEDSIISKNNNNSKANKQILNLFQNKKQFSPDMSLESFNSDKPKNKGNEKNQNKKFDDDILKMDSDFDNDDNTNNDNNKIKNYDSEDDNKKDNKKPNNFMGITLDKKPTLTGGGLFGKQKSLMPVKPMQFAKKQNDSFLAGETYNKPQTQQIQKEKAQFQNISFSNDSGSDKEQEKKSQTKEILPDQVFIKNQNKPKADDSFDFL